MSQKTYNRHFILSPTITEILTLPPLIPVGFFPFANEWEKDMIRNFKFTNCNRFMTLLQSNTTIFLATNGGSADILGSFGWLISSADEILVECGGIVSGKEPDSF